MSRHPYVRERQLRQRNQGLALIAFVLLAYGLLFYWAYRVDASHGITPCQSLANWGMHVCA